MHIVAADIGGMLLATFEVILNAFFAKCKRIAGRLVEFNAVQHDEIQLAS